MATLKVAISHQDMHQVINILASSPGPSQHELDEALADAISSEGDVNVVVPLLSHGAQITQRAFMHAIARHDTDVFQAFIDHGWDINSVEFGEPGLRFANTESQVIWFLEHGADPNIRGKKNFSSLATAALRPSTAILEILISHGADLDTDALFSAMSPRGNGGPVVMEFLIDRGIDINFVMDGQGTPLHYAVAIGSSKKLKLLLKRGADKTIKDLLGLTPLDQAKKQGRKELIRMLSD